MTEIFYRYYSKREHKWKDYSRAFYDVEKAIRFCYTLQGDDYILDGWSTDTIEDNEYIDSRVNMRRINGF